MGAVVGDFLGILTNTSSDPFDFLRLAVQATAIVNAENRGSPVANAVSNDTYLNV